MPDSSTHLIRSDTLQGGKRSTRPHVMKMTACKACLYKECLPCPDGPAPHAILHCAGTTTKNQGRSGPAQSEQLLPGADHIPSSPVTGHPTRGASTALIPAENGRLQDRSSNIPSALLTARAFPGSNSCCRRNTPTCTQPHRSSRLSHTMHTHTPHPQLLPQEPNCQAGQSHSQLSARKPAEGGKGDNS